MTGLLTKLGDTNIIYYEGDVREPKQYKNIDTIIHFASPSDSIEFKDRFKTCTTIIEGTINMINIAIDNNAKIIFASTMGIHEHDIDNIYTTSKLAMENYISSVYNNYVILRIPRVYDKDRKKGLMNSIRNNAIPEEDLDNVVEFITLDEFVEQTIPALDLHCHVFEYDVHHSMTIRNIKRLFDLNTHE